MARPWTMNTKRIHTSNVKTLIIHMICEHLLFFSGPLGVRYYDQPFWLKVTKTMTKKVKREVTGFAVNLGDLFLLSIVWGGVDLNWVSASCTDKSVYVQKLIPRNVLESHVPDSRKTAVYHSWCAHKATYIHYVEKQTYQQRYYSFLKSYKMRMAMEPIARFGYIVKATFSEKIFHCFTLLFP